MRFSAIEEKAAAKLGERLNYKYCYYLEFDFSILGEILSRVKNGSRDKKRYSESYIMFDTETSKDHEPERGAFGRWKPQPNHVCAWSVCIRAFHHDICTLRGSKPSELIHCIELIRQHIKADIIYIFAHNLPYDWQFCRRFFIKEFGIPKKQLNVKNHYPLTIQFANGIVLRDSLILAGMSLERWALNLGVEVNKLHSWDYDRIRNQNAILNDGELAYIECDVRAGVQCLNKLADMLGDTMVSLPFTNTGIVRRIARKEGRKNYAKTDFNKIVGDYAEFTELESVFHGGYVHSNRYKNGFITNDVTCEDYKSSYPYCMLVEGMPAGPFMPVTRDMDPAEIVEKSTKSCYMFKFIATNIRLKDPHFPMPPLQFSKCICTIDITKDNGRILTAGYVEIELNEIDMRLIYDYYTWDGAICTNVKVAVKDYLPKWYRDIVFDIFTQKCQLEYDIKIKKQGDISQYNQIKSRLNSLYGLTVTKPVKDTICERYEDCGESMSGDYYIDSDTDLEKEYNKYLTNRNEILPYSWGCWVTSAAMYNIFQLAKCIGDGEKDLIYHWIYTDTDSIYSDKWNAEKLAAYNREVQEKLKAAGYGGVTIEEKTYWVGVAEFDGFYSEFVAQGSKRYAYIKDGKIGITVAGVPKCGAACLASLDDFVDGFVFPGSMTGKKLHTYMYSDIYIDEHGNECADSIDLSPTDYTLSTVENPLAIDQLLYIDDDGNLVINDTETVYYDWFEDS